MGSGAVRAFCTSRPSSPSCPSSHHVGGKSRFPPLFFFFCPISGTASHARSLLPSFPARPGISRTPRTPSWPQFTGVGNQLLCNTLIISKFQTAQRPTPSQSGRLGARHFTTHLLPISYKAKGSQPLPSFPVPYRHFRLDRESPEHTDRVREKERRAPGPPMEDQ